MRSVTCALTYILRAPWKDVRRDSLIIKAIIIIIIIHLPEISLVIHLEILYLS